MKLLNRINERLALKGEPYSPQEIDEHEYAERIWATIEQCKQESMVAVKEGYDIGYALGKNNE
jgi:hypothetical protein